MEKYTEQEEIRRNSLQKLRELGINPYPAEEFKTNTTSKEIKREFSPSKKKISKYFFSRKNNEQKNNGKSIFF